MNIDKQKNVDDVISGKSDKDGMLYVYILNKYIFRYISLILYYLYLYFR